MATLTVWKFPTATGASEALATLESLQKQELIEIHDGAIVEWEVGKSRPKTRELNDLVGAGALGGAFWGFLFGLIFLVPFLGLAIGAATGAIAGKLTHAGIDDDFINSVREKITPGTSALFIMTSDAVVDRVSAAFEGVQAELIQTNLSKDQEDALRESFAA